MNMTNLGTPNILGDGRNMWRELKQNEGLSTVR